MTGHVVKTFAKSASGLTGHGAAFKSSTDDEVIIVAANRGALGRTCKALGFDDLDLSRVKQVSISDLDVVLPLASTPISPILQRIRNAHHDAMEAAAHPSSKPAREATRAFQKHVDALAIAVTALERSLGSQWAPVTEKLPDDDQLVLISLNDEQVWTGYRDGDIWRYVDAMPVTTERVTHWMPLPCAATKGLV